MVTPAGKRKAVAHLVDAYGMSERRACKAIGCCRMTMRYQTIRADDAGLRQRIRMIAQERRRFGYRRLHVLLKLNAIADESHQTDDVDELLEYAISTIAIIKCSVEAARFSLQASLVDLALDGLLCSDDEGLRRVSNVRTV